MSKATRAAALLGAVILFVLALAWLVVSSWLAPRLEAEIASYLTERTGRKVELASLKWSFRPRLGLSAHGLVIAGRHPGDPPLVTVGRFSVEARFLELFSSPRRVRALRVEEVELFLPSGDNEFDPRERPSPASGTPPNVSLMLDRVHASQIRIHLAPSQPDHPRRSIWIDRLTFEAVSLDRPIPFQAQLELEQPAANINASGTFGPWNSEEPNSSPVSGNFHLEEVDLPLHQGRRALLTAQGVFEGPIEHISASGQSEILEFPTGSPDRTVEMRSEFAVDYVAGGEIRLKEVRSAWLGTELMTEGRIAPPGEGLKGRNIELTVTTDQGRIEDLLTLFAAGSSQGDQAVEGDLTLEAEIKIPPGVGPFVERLSTLGTVEIRDGRFHSQEIRQALEQLGRLGGGPALESVRSERFSVMKSRFQLNHPTLRVDDFILSVPGSEIRLSGRYGLSEESLNFKGTLELARSPSEIAGGRVGEWLKILDPLLRGERAGTVLPLRIEGTRSKPRFALDF